MVSPPTQPLPVHNLLSLVPPLYLAEDKTEVPSEVLKAIRVAIPSDAASLASFQKARTPTPSVAHSSPMDASPAIGTHYLPTGHSGTVPDQPTIPDLTQIYDSLQETVREDLPPSRKSLRTSLTVWVNAW